ncbi:hypothetical protein M422DRAFT_189532 [Sphaerobolus stellatus SS14]|uniref:Uncharacterized protein n=1 Tax=Sphaerobolus stellatus (strain SS14) TaxID=990650 RepID=A0A0C9UI15_SPHS4|nr:hypothetical protein M422DRAFT_189532 [Sphaerobolus stellatus SS14]
MSIASVLPQDAERIKAEGNALFGKGDYANAIDKYTTAISIVPDNAILYANRSACYMALKRYGDARTDAKKATELDPSYSKGWGRLGAAFEVTTNDSTLSPRPVIARV